MDLDLDGQTVVVSGAAGAIAAATAKILLEDGARLLLTDVDADELAEQVGWLDGGDRVRSVVADLSRRGGAETVRDEGVGGDESWRPTAMLHAAGVTGAKGDPLDDIGEEDWEHALQTDLMSAVRMANAFVPAMREAGYGRVVFVTSENVAQPYPDEVVYNVAKAGVLSFAKGLSMVTAQQGVLVNCVAPAFIKTDMTDMMMSQRAEQEGSSVDEAVEEMLEQDRPHLVVGRRGRPEEVAFITATLLSPRASFVNGANFRIDGGSVQSMNV